MMRDIVMALLLLALATLSVMSWFGGTPSVRVESVEADLGR
jgi:hypothetical protein